ncbi:kelch-like protein 17 isoform X2 [Tetranychus urticae]|uniref:kelch-like protein 17 isoform X2 n=1 Tax=Tetranychus urticae TaxID=32264 RepID=UPI00077B9913|nr:kelch-like protein 17 isoform X2 [Tetranychus urticae]
MLIINVTMKSSTEKLPTNGNDLKANDFLTDPQSEPIKSGEIITKGLDCKTNGTNGTNGRLRSINYVNNDHLSAIFSSLNYMRKNGQLCDIILQVAGSQLKAHKVVLSATSAYFNAMFNSEMSEKNKPVIILHDIEFNALKLLIDYAYSGEIVISEENVQALLPTASLLQISPVREACCKFLLRQLDPSNCLGIRQFADAHSCEELHQTSDKFVVENFPAVAKTEEFLLLPYSEVEDLISSNHLNIHDENEVYNAVIRWVKYDLKSREGRLGSLLQHIRFPLIHKNTLLNHVCKEPLMEGNPDGKDLLIEAMRYHLSPDQRTNIKNIRTQYRRPKGLKTYIFAIGGGSLFAIHNECEFYDPVSDTWCSFAPTYKRRSRAGVTTLGRHLYAIGGYNENKELSSGEFYDPIVNSWEPLAQDMGTKRSCLAIATLNGLIYVAGGYDGASCLSSVERFDPLSDMWASVEAMTGRRRHGRLTVLDGCLYAVGGYDGTNYQASMERYDPREARWQLMPPMTNRRSSAGVATLDGKIYAVGGNDGSLCMNTVERFDPTKNAWESVAPMHTRRSTHDVVEADGFLYAIGGNDGSSSLNTVERFEIKGNRWIPINSMMLRRSSVGAAALECPNMEKILEALNHQES